MREETTEEASLEPGSSSKEPRTVARRPAKDSLVDFVRDLRSLARVRTLKIALQEFQRDDAMGLAAQLAYYLILALFPFILVLVSLMGTFGSQDFASTVLGYFRQVTPSPVYTLIETYTEDIISGERPAPGLLSFGVLFTLWSISNAFAALIKALNQAYDAKETRPFWKIRGIAVLMTLGLSGLIFVGMLLMVLGPHLGVIIASFFGFGPVFEFVWNIVRLPAALLFMMITVALLYYFAPNVNQPFRWITPGGLIGVLLWVFASTGFGYYVSNSGSYDRTYGSIGTAIILLLYLYISSLTILFGAELNATLIRMKEKISGQQILDAEPANEKSGILEEEGLEELRDEDKP
jgi:membrane protein